MTKQEFEKRIREVVSSLPRKELEEFFFNSFAPEPGTTPEELEELRLAFEEVAGQGRDQDNQR